MNKTTFENVVKEYKGLISKVLKESLNDADFKKVNEKVMAVSFPTASLKKTKAKKVKTDEPKLKTGYILFSVDFRKKASPDMKSTEIMKEAGKKWKTISEEDKKKWNTKALDMFAKEVAEYKKTHPDYNPAPKKK